MSLASRPRSATRVSRAVQAPKQKEVCRSGKVSGNSFPTLSLDFSLSDQESPRDSCSSSRGSRRFLCKQALSVLPSLEHHAETGEMFLGLISLGQGELVCPKTRRKALFDWTRGPRCQPASGFVTVRIRMELAREHSRACLHEHHTGPDNNRDTRAHTHTQRKNKKTT